MHTCLRKAQIYILRTRAKLATHPFSITPDHKSQFWCFNSSVSFSFSLFCKTVWFKKNKWTCCPYRRAFFSTFWNNSWEHHEDTQGVTKLVGVKYLKVHVARVKWCFIRRKLFQYSARSKNESAQKWKLTQNYLPILILWTGK